MVNRFQMGIALWLAINMSGAFAEDWYPSQFGADDTLGAINHLSPALVLEAAKLIKTGKTYPLGVETGSKSPAYAPRTYSMTVLQLSDGTGTPYGSNKATGNDDLMVTWMGIGSQIDGLGHLGIDHVYYNGNKAQDFVKNTGLTKMSIDTLPPIVARGVLLDMARHLGKPILDAGTAFNQAEIEAAAQGQGVTLKKGDVVLFHTGWLNIADQDPVRFMAGEPGIGVGGAAYLAKLGAVAVGSDTWALEVMPSEVEGEFVPVHQELLTKNGVYILENMDTRALAKDEAWEFLFVLGQPRFVGAVQAVINPVAIR
ncbi:MAG: kynurenine formamidase [Gammaproteobacteria bacterium]|jgi:kynurenine formamidase